MLYEIFVTVTPTLVSGLNGPAGMAVATIPEPSSLTRYSSYLFFRNSVCGSDLLVTNGRNSIDKYGKTVKPTLIAGSRLTSEEETPTASAMSPENLDKGVPYLFRRGLGGLFALCIRSSRLASRPNVAHPRAPARRHILGGMDGYASVTKTEGSEIQRGRLILDFGDRGLHGKLPMGIQQLQRKEEK